MKINKFKTFNQHIVIVGGGAGGLELATRLAKKYARKGLQVTLVDSESTHVWKPLLHEVATGSLDAGLDELSYNAQARSAGFRFQKGRMESLDRKAKYILLEPVYGIDSDIILPKRVIHYDYLVIAVGSISNEFGIPGVSDHCFFLDNRNEAELFHHTLLDAWLKASNTDEGCLRIALVGGGATGVELAAELYNCARELRAYGFTKKDLSRLEVILVEAGNRILPGLPERISTSVTYELGQLGVSVRTRTKITSVTQNSLITDSGEQIQANLKVWAAGIQAPEFVKHLDGLETNHIGQLLVKHDLRTSIDSHIFALGDCASCEQVDGSRVPPRAQAAHQMATYLYKQLPYIVKNHPLPPFHYRDHGSLVSLSRYSTVGSLMGNLTRGNMIIEGRLARLVYVSLYRMHQLVLYGYLKTALITLVDRINRVIRPRLKLH